MARITQRVTKPISSTLTAMLLSIGTPEWRAALARLGVPRQSLRTMAPLAMAKLLVAMEGGAA